MSDEDRMKFSDLDPDQFLALETNWKAAQGMLAHLVAMHANGPDVPHPAVMSDREVEQMQMLDGPAMLMVLRAAVIALSGASVFVMNTLGGDGINEFLKRYGK